MHLMFESMTCNAYCHQICGSAGRSGRIVHQSVKRIRTAYPLVGYICANRWSSPRFPAHIMFGMG